jgi:DNA-binding NarL/FixJ family response regulator
LIRLSEAGDISRRKLSDSSGLKIVRLPAQTVLRLEQLRQQTEKQSIAEVISAAVELYARLRATESAASDQLTPWLLEVLRLVADGTSTKGIASRLKISVKTAEFHRAKLMRKLGVRSIAGLVRYAIRAGVLLP